MGAQLAGRVVLLASALLAGCVFDDSPSRRPLLAVCTFNDECESGNVCAARQCRAECRTDLDCTNGWRCLSAGQPDKRVCYEPGNLFVACEYSSDCLGHYVCGPAAQCRPQCTDAYDCQIRAAGSQCVLYAPGMGVCDDHPHLLPDGGLLDVERNDGVDAGVGR